MVGKIRDLHDAEQVLADGSADMVAMARQLLTDAHTVNKTREGREHEIIRCNRCNECAGRLFEHRELICALNPVSGREAYWGEGSAPAVADNGRRRILVVGGGPAGMKAAAVAARRGHKVVLREAREELGGHLRLYARLPAMSDWSLAIDNLEREVSNAGVTVETGNAVTRSSILEADYDGVAIATGARYESSGLSLYRPERNAVPGAELGHVIDLGSAAQRLLDDPTSLGKRVIIVDESGGHLPFAVAELIARGGGEVEIVSPRLYAGEKIYRNLDMAYIFPRIKGMGVTITHQHFIEKIEPHSVDIYDIWTGPETAVKRPDVDCVVMSILRVPNDTLYFEMREDCENIDRIGDVAAPRDVAAALHDAEVYGRAI